MSGHEDIRTIATRLEELYGHLRDEALTIDQTMEKVTEAISLYRIFKKHFAESEFDVKAIHRDSKGHVTEKAFDWRALS